MTMPADRERDRRSLQDLAKMAQDLTPPPSSMAPSAPSGVQRSSEDARTKEDDSGIVDLAAASQVDPFAAARAESTPLATQGLFDDEPTRSERPPPASASTAPLAAPISAKELPAQPIPSMPPASIPLASPSVTSAVTNDPKPIMLSEVAAAPRAKKRSGLALAIGGVMAVAAGGFLFFNNSRGDTSESAAAPTSVAPEPTAALVPAEPPPSKAEEPTMTTAELTANAEEPASEPAAAEPAAGSKAPPKAVAVAQAPQKGGAPAVTPKEAPAPAASPADAPVALTEKDLAPAAAGPTDLGAAIKKEVGEDAPKTPAAATAGGSNVTGNVPTKPSQGAITGAIGAVLPGARACLGPDDPISRATLVFSSEGTVQSVKVTGGAAGKPAEACIKGALMKARVTPFAEPSYSANITVRHN